MSIQDDRFQELGRQLDRGECPTTITPDFLLDVAALYEAYQTLKTGALRLAEVWEAHTLQHQQCAISLRELISPSPERNKTHVDD